RGSSFPAKCQSPLFPSYAERESHISKRCCTKTGRAFRPPGPVSAVAAGMAALVVAAAVVAAGVLLT
ncbi:Helix-turn-helix domain-containing protein, partial [Dysosmobacter welbionis]